MWQGELTLRGSISAIFPPATPSRETEEMGIREILLIE
jgi:hypothetical protein